LTIFSFLSLFGLVTLSCFSLSSGDNVVFGRNHDATLKNRLIVFNPKNIYKEGFEFPEENYPSRNRNMQVYLLMFLESVLQSVA
jgi:hypothetical protein